LTELARCKAEEELRRYHYEMENRIDVMVRGVKEEMERAASRLNAAEAQLIAAERRAALAEDRANKAESSVRRLETTIRVHALGKNLNLLVNAA
jgi:hypothetical protein